MCCKKSVLKNCPIVTGRTLVLKFLFNKVAGLQTCNFIKKRLQHRRFLVNIEKLFRITFWKNICERLLLKVVFMWKKEILIPFISNFEQSERKISTSVSFCITNNFLVSWNYGFQNSVCSIKESFICRGSFTTQIL